MSFRISAASTVSLLKWGAAMALTTVGAVLLAKKVETFFNKKLLDVTSSYLAFINRIGKGEVFPHEKEISSLLTPDCKKILNGKLHTNTSAAFVSDLLAVHQTQGTWNVTPVDTIESSQHKTVTLRLIIDMKNQGLFTAIVLIRFNSNNLISEINEVFTKMEDSYNFEGNKK